MSSKISLCIIVGNVEEYIERCLSSFAPIADEIIVVRAIGNLKPDRTLDIAREKFKAKTGIYHNKKAGKLWPHVDDFAAARQMSFDLATGDYCFWCDSDDVLESGAEIVRELADRGGYACYIFPYRIFGKHINVMRERMILKSAGAWEMAVHEAFHFTIEPVQAVEDQRVVVKHLPHLSKSGSNDRNLRILRNVPESKMTTGLYYHLHQELALKGDIAGSVAAAKKFMARPDAGQPERFELFVNLATVDPDIHRQEAFLHEAYKTDPRRREALMLLANHSLNHGQPENGLAYARQMMATRKPAFVEWNERLAVYGWAGEEIFCQALRANGYLQDADTIRREAMAERGGARIALIHATRGRPEQAARARKLWLDLAEQPGRVEHIFVFDQDDAQSQVLARMHSLCLPRGGGCVAAWNAGALVTEAPVIVQLSDDWIPTPGWDDAILQRLGDVTQPKVLAISDGIRSDPLLCMAICTRAYMAQDFFLFHPWFTGVYSDNWFTELAYERGQVIEAKDLVFTHDHPLASGKPMDLTYQKQNAPQRYHEGEEVITQLRARQDWSSVPGFFNYWSFYDRVAARLQDGDTIAEVGVWLGRSSIYLAQALKRQGKKVKTIAVDNFKGESNQVEHEATVRLAGGNFRHLYEENLFRCGVADRFEILDGDSAELAANVANHSLAFCFVDAAHDYESVKRDLAAWGPKVKPGGLLAGHDADWPDVKKAVQEIYPAAGFNGCLWMQEVK